MDNIIDLCSKFLDTPVGARLWIVASLMNWNWQISFQNVPEAFEGTATAATFGQLISGLIYWIIFWFTTQIRRPHVGAWKLLKETNFAL